MSDDLDYLLDRAGPSGTFLRFLLAHTGREDLFDVRGDAVWSHGRRARVHVVGGWLLGPPGPESEALVREILADPSVDSAYIDVGEPVSPPEGWQLVTDRILVHPGPLPAPDAQVVSGRAFDERVEAGQLHPALADLVPPPAIWSRLPFRFHGVVEGDAIVAMCDTTVDDGTHVVVQQVHTAPEHRGRGLGARVARGAVAANPDRRALWVCDLENRASEATARAAGFVRLREVPLLVRDR